MLGKKIFELLWGLIDDQDPPAPKYRRVRLGKLAAALMLEGAIFRLIRGFAEHGARHGFSAAVGRMARRREPPTEGRIMSAADQISRITPYLERLLLDDYIQEQLGDAVIGLRRSSRRAKGRGRPRRSRIAGCATSSAPPRGL